MVAAPTASSRPASIMASRHWRTAIVCSGFSKTTMLFLPIYVVGALGQGVGVAASAVAAFTFGAMIANLLLWGRLADRTNHPHAMAFIGPVAFGLALIGTAVFPGFAGIVALAAVMGVFSVAADGPLVRLAAGQQSPADRTVSVLSYARRIEVGMLIGLFCLAVVLPSVGAFTDAGLGLRLGMVAIGLAALLQAIMSAWGAGTATVNPAATGRLAGDGLIVIWASVSGPMRAIPWGGPVRGRRLAPVRAILPDSLKLMLINLAVLYLGFNLHGAIFGVYLREETGINDGGVMALYTAGAFLTNLAMVRINDWLRSIPAVQVQAGVVAVRVVLFLAFAVLAIVPAPLWSVLLVVFVFLVSQVSWGALVPANTARVTDLAPDTRRAEVMSYYNAAIAGGLVLGATFTGPLAVEFGYPAAFAAAALATAMSLVLLLRW